MSELVEVLVDGPVVSPGAKWTPSVGEELLAFLDTVHPDAKDKTRVECVSILSRGTPPGVAEVTTGLVVGYVQSGKTTSFTAAAALARDNGIGLVIIIAGTSTNLLDQTQDRLAADLRLGEKNAYRRWVHVKSPKPSTEDASKVEAALEDQLDDDLDPSDRATVLITVMKQHRHLGWLIDVLDDIGCRLDLSALTALIIDDEADQASPNVKRKVGEESATYGQIRKLRSLLPAHTFLEYTATPQATLLVSLVDEISPDYVCVIDPGSAYTGGRYFFQEHRSEFIEHIPESDVQSIDEDASDPPRSLLKAFAVFALGCAAGRLDSDGPAQRSMLVHPSQKTLPQARFVSWLKNIRDLWVTLLKSVEGDEDRLDLIERWLEPAYANLAVSVEDLPPFEDLVKRLPGVLKKTSIEEVNATRGRPQPIMWSTGYAWVLVGGQLLDRGFTVEGLTVTYMPRGLGIGNADTVQQRARFFGYKQSYAGYCRAWLDPGVDHAFSNYVNHEEAMRRELVEVAKSGQSLKDWKRVFLLSKRMRLTRAAVIRLDTARSTFAKKWFGQEHFEAVDTSIFEVNRSIVKSFRDSHAWSDDPGDPRRDRDTQVHPFTDIDLNIGLDSLLKDFVMTEDDAIEFAALRVLLAVAADEGQETCRVHMMSGHSTRRRRRSLNEAGRIKNLFQGANANTGYDGDRAVRSDDVTVQIHRLDLMTDDGTDEGTSGRVVASDVPVLAVWVPERLDTSVIVQRLT